jgi:cytochrome P450
MKNQHQKSNLLPLPPGNLSWPLVGETLSFLSDPDFADKRHKKYGNIFKTRIFGQPTVYISGAEANRFFLTQENKYVEVDWPPSTKALFGQSSISNQVGEMHKSRRQILYQAFQPRALDSYFSTLRQITQDYLEEWARRGTLTWYPALQDYTFDLACRFLIGLDEASQTPMRPLYETWAAGLFSFSTIRLPWTKFGRAWRSRQQLLAEIEQLVKKRQQEPESGSDALGILLQARDEAGQHLSLDELKEQLLGLLFAGHGTLTSALASFCLLMAQHPQVLAQVREEQQQLAGTLTPEQLQQMPYLEQVLQEVLRLIPPVGGGFRKVIQDCEYQGWHIPQGWALLYQIPQTHQDARAYPDPEKFDPERFSPTSGTAPTKPFGYLPFGGGLRECLGKEFARLEMRVFAAALARDYTWELLPEQDLQVELIPVPRPRDGLKVKLTRH